MIDCPVALVVRGCSFLAGASSAVTIMGPSVAANIDLGAADAGNIFQSIAQPNVTGVCSQVAGAVKADGSGFKSCPPTTGTWCANGVDVSVIASGSIDTTGYYVAN